MTNTDIWAALGKTDPRHTKPFKRAGGFSGTALKPIWIIKRLTEQFGPVGVGWGIGAPSFQTVDAAGEVLVYCTVACWHGKPDNVFYGVGGDKVLTKRQSGMFADDEAFKKAFTDAVGNAFKFLGVGADIHMGQFDDSKYVRMTGAEFAASEKGQGHSQDGAVSPAPPQGDDAGEPHRKTGRKLDGPYTSTTALEAAIKQFVADMAKVGLNEEWQMLKRDRAALLKQAENDHPDWWNGWPTQPDGFVPLRRKIEILEAQLAEATEQQEAAE